MTFVSDGMTLLSDQLQQHVGRDATYTRLANSAAITATVILQDYTVTDEAGLKTSVWSFDLIVERSQLKFSGTAFDPRPGDRITLVRGLETMTLEAMPIGDRRCFEWVDEDGTMVTIHTKKVS